MAMTFRLTDAGRRVRERPGFYQHAEETMKLLGTMAHGALSFDSIVRHAPAEMVEPSGMYKMLQAMATALAMGLLEVDLPSEKDRRFGHGHWG